MSGINKEQKEMKKFIEFLAEGKKLTDHKVGDIVRIGTPGTRDKVMTQITKVHKDKIVTSHGRTFSKKTNVERLDHRSHVIGAPDTRPKKSGFGKASHVERATDKEKEDTYKKDLTQKIRDSVNRLNHNNLKPEHLEKILHHVNKHGHNSLTTVFDHRTWKHKALKDE